MPGGQRRRRDDEADDVEADRDRRRDSRIAETVEVRAYGLADEPRRLRRPTLSSRPTSRAPARARSAPVQISGAPRHWLISTQVRTATSAVDAVIVCLQSPTTTRDPTSVVKVAPGQPTMASPSPRRRTRAAEAAVAERPVRQRSQREAADDLRQRVG